MYRATATALALVSFLPRVGVGYQSVDLCCPPPCGCEPPPVVCCDPCEPSQPALKKTAPSELPPPPPAPAPAPNADAITPQPLNAPAIVEASPLPAEAPTVPAATPTVQEFAPAEPAPRYGDAFSESPSTIVSPTIETPEPATTGPETPATEPEPAAAAPADDVFTAPAEETTPPAEEPAPAPAADPPSEAPEGEQLFGPGAARDVLTQPGGWASDASRPWVDAEGKLLVTGRITEVTAKFVVLLREDGQSQAVRYAHLGNQDLSFLRQQIEARRGQLASQSGGDELLAEQSR